MVSLSVSASAANTSVAETTPMIRPILSTTGRPEICPSASDTTASAMQASLLMVLTLGCMSSATFMASSVVMDASKVARIR
jgi:hypothetical protein